MDTLMDVCFLCMKVYNNVAVNNTIVNKVKYLLPEITLIKLGIPLSICIACTGELNAYSKFKKCSVESSRRLETWLKGAQANLPGPPLPDPPIPGRTLRVVPQTQLLQTEVAPNMNLHTDTHTENTNRMSVTTNQTQVTKRTYNSGGGNMPKEQCSQRQQSTDGASPSSGTIDTYTELYHEEIFIKQEPLEESSLNIDVCLSNQTNYYSEDKNITLNETVTFKTELELEEKIFIKKEPFEKLSEDMEICNNGLENNCQVNRSQCNTDPKNAILNISVTSEVEHDAIENVFIKEEALENTSEDIEIDKMFQNTLEQQNKTNNQAEQTSESENASLDKTAFFSSSESEEEQEDDDFDNFFPKKFHCESCNKTFKYKSDFVRHEKIHSGVKDFTCEFCNKFITGGKHHYKNHLKLHSGIKDFPCTLCSKAFVSIGRLNQHLKIHAKNYQCEICNKMFAQKSSFDNHVMSHSGRKDFSCSVCNKAFTCQKNVTQHMNVHRKHNEFSCNICSKSFAQKSLFDNHMRSHSEKLKFVCSICSMAFGFECHLIRHMKTHS